MSENTQKFEMGDEIECVYKNTGVHIPGSRCITDDPEPISSSLCDIPPTVVIPLNSYISLIQSDAHTKSNYAVLYNAIVAHDYDLTKLREIVSLLDSSD